MKMKSSNVDFDRKWSNPHNDLQMGVHQLVNASILTYINSPNDKIAVGGVYEWLISKSSRL